MYHLNSEMEKDRLFAETKTLYDFFELEEMWEASHQNKDQAFIRFIHKITDEDYLTHWYNRHN